MLARQTLFVEIGPVVSFRHDIYDLVFPFDETNPMGWGFENVWARRVRDADRTQGIVDAVPVDHSIRQPVAYYEWSDAVADRERYLATQPPPPLEECFRCLRDRPSAPVTPNRYFFVHMQKTAGIALRHRLIHHFGAPPSTRPEALTERIR